MGKTSIEWADKVWNPVTGCTKVSEGCRNCYAERIAGRFWGDRKFTDVQVHTEKLGEPLHWKKPVRVFVNSMSDLFHPDIPDDFIHCVFAVMRSCERHTFMILTKRPERMLQYLSAENTSYEIQSRFTGMRFNGYIPEPGSIDYVPLRQWPLPNVWLGVSVENQEEADKRIPLLLKTPAALRFVSYEPALGPIDLQSDALGDTLCRCGGCLDLANNNPDMWRAQRIDWVICGGESGTAARPIHPDWARSVRDQCVAANVPFFFKQWGEWLPTHQGTVAGFTFPKVTRVWCWKDENLVSIRIGKTKAGSLLDGTEWKQFPQT